MSGALPQSAAGPPGGIPESAVPLLISVVPDAMIVVDARGRIVAANDRAERMFGWGRGELAGEPLAVLVPESFRSLHTHQTKEYLLHPRLRAMGSGLKLEGRRKDGTLFPVDISLALLQTDHSQLTTATIRDLSASEASYRGLVEGSIQGILVHRDGRVVFANPALVSALGYAGAGELVGRSVDDLVAPEDQQRIAALREVWERSGTAPIRYETRIHRRDGVPGWFDCISSRTYWNGAPASLVTMVDISERRHAEDRLRASEEQFRELAENVRECFFVVDLPSGRTTYVSPAWSEIWGRDLAEAYARPDAWLESVHPEDRSAMAASVGALGRGEPAETTFRVVRPDGTVRWVRSRAFPVKDSAGQVYRRVGLVQDITKERLAVEALRESEARYRGLVEGSIQGISIRCGRLLVFANHAFAKMLGWERPEDIVGRPLADFLSPEGWSHAQEKAAALVRGEMNSARYEVQLRRREGTSAWAEVVVTRTDWDGEAAFLATLMDVTERRKLEEQYRQAQKMEAIGQLAGGVAHDFNNLLTAITGYTDLVREDLPAGDQRREDLTEVLGAAQRAAALTRQLLAFSRRQVLQPRVLNINEVVAGMQKMLRRMIGEDVVLKTKPDPRLPSVRADPGQIEQVIMNLAVNARDAMPGGGTLTVETATADLGEDYADAHAEVRSGRYVLLAISDTGHGMDEETRVRIFEPFFTTKGPGKGTGLGLSTVYGIVKQSGGHVTAYSEVGEGTTMKVYLPVVDAEVEPVGQTAGDAAPGTGSETILLVEDEKNVRKLARDILARYGYTVLEARDGAEAVALCHSHGGEIHLMVSDVVMPGMGGPESAGVIHRLRPGMKLLLMSGYADRAVTEHRVLDPHTPFLQKPFTPTALARKVREVLDG